MATPKVRLGLGRPSTKLSDYLAWLKVAEEYDPDILGYGDGQELWNELYVVLTLTAVHTKRAMFGSLVTNPVTRDPGVTASAIATLQDYSGGRAYLGIATGLSALRNGGLKAARMSDLEEYVRAVQGLTAGKTVSYRGRSVRIQWGPSRVPVFIGARGPKGLALAGRVADGVIVGGGVTSAEVIRKLLGQIRAGCDSVGRDMSELQIWFLTRVVVAPSREAGVDMMRDYLAGHAAHSYAAPSILAEAPKDVQEKIHVMERGYKWGEHLIGKPGPDGLTDNARLLESTGIKNWLANRFVITGSPKDCIAGLRELAGAGATNHIIPQVLPGQMESTRLLGQHVFPAFR